jgi:hypothetical protein
MSGACDTSARQQRKQSASSSNNSGGGKTKQQQPPAACNSRTGGEQSRLGGGGSTASRSGGGADHSRTSSGSSGGYFSGIVPSSFPVFCFQCVADPESDPNSSWQQLRYFSDKFRPVFRGLFSMCRGPGIGFDRSSWYGVRNKDGRKLCPTVLPLKFRVWILAEVRYLSRKLALQLVSDVVLVLSLCFYLLAQEKTASIFRYSLLRL